VKDTADNNEKPKKEDLDSQTSSDDVLAELHVPFAITGSKKPSAFKLFSFIE
jgi:hypothetical protein